MYKNEIRNVIDLLGKPQISVITAKRAIILLVRLEAQINWLSKELGQAKMEQYINGRNDGIDDFVKRIEPKLANNINIGLAEYHSVIADINNLVKEMTEKTNDAIL